jgi:hypothetical protein
VIIRPSNLDPSRREFLQGLFPGGALLLSSCGLLTASSGLQNKPAKHKFLEDSGLSMREAFRFAFLWSYIPMMEAVATRIGREKFVEMLREATGIYWAQYTKN